MSFALHTKWAALAAVITSLLILPSCGSEKSANTAQQADQSQTTAESVAGTESNAQMETTKANEMFARFFEESVARSPMYQTYLGRKQDNDKWDNLSEAYERETLEMHKRQLAELHTLNVELLPANEALSYELMRQDLENSIADFKWRMHNYPVEQMHGTHSAVPALLINQHRVKDLADAKAYITRVKTVDKFFAQMREGIEERAAIGISPPKFVFAHVIRDSLNIIKGAPFEANAADNALLADFKTKVGALVQKEAISEEKADALVASLNKALLGEFKSAYNGLVEHLQALEKTADTNDGVWKWPEGDAFYNVALQRTTTTNMTAEDIHQLGLNEVARIHKEMNAIKDQVEFDGDLKAFMQFMRDDQRFYYPDTEEGKQRYLSEATALIDNLKLRLDEFFITKPKAELIVKAVEPFREQSAGKAFYQRPSEDGSRPGIYYANLYDMKSMPTYQMEALAYHEGIPGHHMQLAIAQELQGVPKFRKHGGYTAYTEGWGLYSEFIPKEIGLYADPYSDFGRLAMELWRACRLVVDTGIHAKKWTREQGIDYYVSNTPNSVWDATKMVERHIVMPSQATAYKVGMLKILELREKARDTLGEKFDIRVYHDEVLKYGAVPLNVLQRIVDEWVERRSAG